MARQLILLITLQIMLLQLSAVQAGINVDANLQSFACSYLDYAKEFNRKFNNTCDDYDIRCKLSAEYDLAYKTVELINDFQYVENSYPDAYALKRIMQKRIGLINDALIGIPEYQVALASNLLSSSIVGVVSRLIKTKMTEDKLEHLVFRVNSQKELVKKHNAGLLNGRNLSMSACEN